MTSPQPQPQQFPVPPGVADQQQPAQPVYVQPTAQPAPPQQPPVTLGHTATPEEMSGMGLNLDTMEREGTPDLFWFVLNGRRYTLKDPQGIDWKALVSAMRNPVLFFKSVTESDGDYREFMAQDLPVWKLNAVMKGYYTHYGMPDADSLSALLG